jgi:hypothetical protein
LGGFLFFYLFLSLAGTGIFQPPYFLAIKPIFNLSTFISHFNLGFGYICGQVISKKLIL